MARNAAHIAALEKQLAEAKQQVQDIAVKAIEGASGCQDPVAHQSDRHGAGQEPAPGVISLSTPLLSV